MISVAMVEDDSSFSDAVTAMLHAETDLTLVATADTLASGLHLLSSSPADVLIADLGLPDGSGIDLIRAARRRWPKADIVVATLFGDEERVLAAIEAGASGYLLKDDMPASLPDELRRVRNGASPLNPRIARLVLRRLQPPKLSGRAKDAASLTMREVQVLERLALGHSMRETGEFLGIAPTTVQTFTRRIYEKLSVRSRVSAVNVARQRGWLRSSPP